MYKTLNEFIDAQSQEDKAICQMLMKEECPQQERIQHCKRYGDCCSAA